MRKYRLTAKQKKWLSAHEPRLRIDNWLFVKESESEIVLVNKISNKEKRIKKT